MSYFVLTQPRNAQTEEMANSANAEKSKSLWRRALFAAFGIFLTSIGLMTLASLASHYGVHWHQYIKQIIENYKSIVYPFYEEILLRPARALGIHIILSDYEKDIISACAFALSAANAESSFRDGKLLAANIYDQTLSYFKYIRLAIFSLSQFVEIDEKSNYYAGIIYRASMFDGRAYRELVAGVTGVASLLVGCLITLYFSEIWFHCTGFRGATLISFSAAITILLSAFWYPDNIIIYDKHTGKINFNLFTILHKISIGIILFIMILTSIIVHIISSPFVAWRTTSFTLFLFSILYFANMLITRPL